MGKKHRLLVLIFLFGCVSAYFHFSFYPLGSNEATLLLEKKPSIVKWEKFDLNKNQTVSAIVDEDTYDNFMPQENIQLKKDVQSKPSLYIKNKDAIYPLFMQTRTGALPHFINRLLALVTSPAFSLGLFSWLCGLVCYAASLGYVERMSGYGLIFGLVALLTPQIVYFLGPSYHDFHLSLAIFSLILFLTTGKEDRTKMILIGFLLGLSLYVKLASFIFLPLLLLFQWSRLRPFLLWVLAGMVPFLLFLGWSTDWNDLTLIVFRERQLAKSWDFQVLALKEFFYYVFVPDKIFPFIFKDVTLATPLSSVWSVLFIILSAAILVLSTAFLTLKKGMKILIFLFFYLAFVITIAHSLHEDIFSYFSQGIFLTTVFFTSCLRKGKWPNLGRYVLVVFLILKSVTFFSWSHEFRKIRNEFPGCIWLYECMTHDLVDSGLLKKGRLVTLNYLDVGQMEFFSGGELIPLHTYWKYGREPQREEFIEFLRRLSPGETYLLASSGYDGRDLSYYLKVSPHEVEKVLDEKGLKLELVKSYSYPLFEKHYQVIRLMAK